MQQRDLPSIGLPFEGGYFGGIVRVRDTLHAIAWAPKADGEAEHVWLPKRADAPGTHSCCDSVENTLAMADAGSALAKWALGLRIGGHDDWCIPARDVLELAYRHLKPTTHETCCSFRDGDNPSSVPAGYPYGSAGVVQTSVQAFQAGGPEATRTRKAKAEVVADAPVDAFAALVAADKAFADELTEMADEVKGQGGDHAQFAALVRAEFAETDLTEIVLAAVDAEGAWGF